jgi:DNA-binding beta-propeller fold protein YncE
VSNDTHIGSNGSLTVLDRNPASGVLSEGKGVSCFSHDGSGGACQKDPAVTKAFDLAVSPDGKSVYSLNGDINRFAAFSRDPASGQLTQLPSAVACIPSAPVCERTDTFGDQGEIAVSPDGKSLYLAAVEGKIGIFDRNQQTGELTQKQGALGCVSENGKEGCTPGKGLREAEGIVVSPDGRNVYTSAYFGSALVAILDRDPATGALTQSQGKEGCISRADAKEGCETGRAFGASTGLTISPDGKDVYVASSGSNGVATFARGGK